MRKLMTGVLAATLAACGGGGDDTPTGTGQTPTLALALSGSTVSVQQGSSNTITATITRGGGLTANVDLSVEGAPAGVSVAFTPTSLGSGVTSSTLSIAASSAAAAGTTTLTVRAKSTGVTDKTATIGLTVTAAPTGGFSLAASAVAGSITQGASGTSTITITRTAPFAGAVALAVTGAPTGVTPTLNPTSVTAATSTLTIATAANTTPGTYTLTITGTGTGVSNATTTVPFTVVAPAPASGNVAWTFCAANAPIWMAAQDGAAGAWARVTPGTSNDFKFTVNGTVGGVAYVTTTNGSFTLNIVYGTQAELIAQGVAQCPGGATKTFTGAIAGLPAGDAAIVAMGGASATATANGPFTLTNVPSGLQDLIASDYTTSVFGGSINTQVKKIILRRDLNLANNAILPTLDFSATEAFAPSSANATLANGGTDALSTSSLYFTANGSAGSFSTDVSGSATRTYYGLPAARQVAGDLHGLIAQAIVVNGATATQVRSATLFFKDIGNKTLTFGPAPTTPTITTVATTPVARLRAQWTVQTEYNKSFLLSYSQTISGTSRTVTITASNGYFGGNPTSIDITMPDLSGVAGWDNNWGLRAGTSTTWLSSSSGWTFTGASTSPADAGVILSGTKLGTVTP